MEWQTTYSDANMNPYGVAQMQQFSVQRMEQNPGVNSYSGRVDSYRPDEEQRSYSSTRAEGQWQWERDTQPMSPHLYREGKCSSVHGQVSDASISPYQRQGGESKLGSSRDPRAQTQETDIAIGALNNASPRSFEALEKNFIDDVMKVTKEHMDAEDAENIRHRERIVSINNEYQQNLEALRARHAERREEFLRRESQGRLQRYHLAGMAHYPNNSTVHRGPAFSDGGSGGSGGTVPAGDAQRGAAANTFGGAGHYNSRRQHQRPNESFGQGRMQGRGGGVRGRGRGGADGRLPHTVSRLYDSGAPTRYY